VQFCATNIAPILIMVTVYPGWSIPCPQMRSTPESLIYAKKNDVENCGLYEKSEAESA